MSDLHVVSCLLNRFTKCTTKNIKKGDIVVLAAVSVGAICQQQQPDAVKMQHLKSLVLIAGLACLTSVLMQLMILFITNQSVMAFIFSINLLIVQSIKLHKIVKTVTIYKLSKVMSRLVLSKSN